jgi:adenosine deaminase
MNPSKNEPISFLTKHLINTISETNGLSLSDTLELASMGAELEERPVVKKQITEFRHLLASYHNDEADINTLLNHPVAESLFFFFKNFPMNFLEEHIHLTGSLSADFLFPRLQKVFNGPHGAKAKSQIQKVYGKDVAIESVEDVRSLITLKDDEFFDRYLQILYLPKLVLIDRESHAAASYHMAEELYTKYNVGMIRLKFTLSRASQNEMDQIPGADQVTTEDVVLGLFEGFKSFQKLVPHFRFVLSPSFRKESDFYDSKNYASKKEHFLDQVKELLGLMEKYPELKNYLCDVDTVGNERDLYRKTHFTDMKLGFRKLQFRGLSIRSHHGETWHTLKKGVQAVDNAMNIWHIDTLEHGLSLGINPNFYFHRLFIRAMEKNINGQKISANSADGRELEEMDWGKNQQILEKLFKGTPITDAEKTLFLKVKFHMAREVEHYQHDVLNRMLQKDVGLVALPSSNNKLTHFFPDYKDHPFSWWEKKGVRLGIGTDNYITLDTNYINEMLIILFTDPYNLKITKLLMVATGENRRPYMSQLLWRMREMFLHESP